jgi:hypothetical protein
MAVQKGPRFSIDNVESFTTGQRQVIGPLDGDYRLTEAQFWGDTATIPGVAAGTYNTTTGVFTAVTTLVNGINGSSSTIGTTTSLANAPLVPAGTAVTAFVAATPIAAGQYLRITAGSNALVRYRFELESVASAAGFTVTTTPV